MKKITIMLFMGFFIAFHISPVLAGDTIGAKPTGSGQQTGTNTNSSGTISNKTYSTSPKPNTTTATTATSPYNMQTSVNTTPTQTATYSSSDSTLTNAAQTVISEEEQGGFSAYVKFAFDTRMTKQRITRNHDLALTLYYLDKKNAAHTVATGNCYQKEDSNKNGVGTGTCWLYGINPASVDFSALYLAIKPEGRLVLRSSAAEITYYDENDNYIDTVTSHNEEPDTCYSALSIYEIGETYSGKDEDVDYCDSITTNLVYEANIDYTYDGTVVDPINPGTNGF